MTRERGRARARAGAGVTVVQALPKGDRGELAVEVLTEVGVDRSCRGPRRDRSRSGAGERADKSLARWRSTAREAAKQSRRSWFPEVADLAYHRRGRRARRPRTWPWCCTRPAATSLAAARLPTSGTVVVVVGPEGGITDDELAAFTDAGAHVVRLGDEVLRTSTAGSRGGSTAVTHGPVGCRSSDR